MMTTPQQAAALASLGDLTHTQAGQCFARLAVNLADDPQSPPDLVHRAALCAALFTHPRGQAGCAFEFAEALASEAADRTPHAWQSALPRPRQLSAN